MKSAYQIFGQQISTGKQGIEALANQIVNMLNIDTLLDGNGAPILCDVQEENNALAKFAIARALQAAAEQATKLLTEAAINEALRLDENRNPVYPGAAEGLDFIAFGDKFRLMIHNEYPYGEQYINGADGSRRLDPNSALWNAEQAVVAKRKEDNKLSTKKLSTWEAELRASHKRMSPIKTTVSISLRNV